jgi:hypothetical protein
MPRGQAISDEFPDRCLDQMGRQLSNKTALNLFNTGNFSGGPDFLQSHDNVGICGKVLSASMQVGQIVVSLDRERLLSANPENALLNVCEPSCSLCFGKVTITAFVIFHPRLSDEWLPRCESPYNIGKVIVKVALKRVANREGGMLGDRKTIGISKLRTNVATCVALHLGVIFKPENEAFFELATERLFDRGSRAHLEAGDPPRNGTTRKF